jgi:hypothetical protein
MDGGKGDKASAGRRIARLALGIAAGAGLGLAYSLLMRATGST